MAQSERAIACLLPILSPTHTVRTQYQTNFKQITNHCAAPSACPSRPLLHSLPIQPKLFDANNFLSHFTDESILSEDPTPAETTHHGGNGVSGISSISSSSGVGAGASIGSGPNDKQSTLLILAAVVAIGVVVVTSIIVAGIVVVCRHRPRPPEPQEVRKSMR